MTAVRLLQEEVAVATAPHLTDAEIRLDALRRQIATADASSILRVAAGGAYRDGRWDGFEKDEWGIHTGTDGEGI